MARRQRNKTAEGLIELASMLPWWLALILAVVSYLGLSHFAAMPLTVQQVVPGQISQVVYASLGRALVQVGQYVVPLLLLAGAGVSFVRRKKSESLLDAATSQGGADAIRGMSWREFEMLIAEGFRRRGFSVQDKGGKGADGGVDLVLLKGSERFLVQCKQWRALKVGVAVVRELYGVMSAEGAVGGIVVTSGAFTEDAKDFAKGRNIRLVDGPLLQQILASGKQANPSTTEPKRPADTSKALPMCPKCGAEMRVREAKKGATAGNKFLGCSTYPACKGTLPL